MALTASEETLIRQLLAQQSAILSLAENEATITSKLGATKVTLDGLGSASSVNDADLVFMRQGVSDRTVTPLLLRGYMQDGSPTKEGIQKGTYNVSIATGTGNVFSASFTPGLTSLTTGTIVFVRASGVNTSTTPTFNAHGLGPVIVAKGLGDPLSLGDIAGAGYWLVLQYDGFFNKWMLLNPANGVSPQIPIGSIAYMATPTPPSGYLKADGGVVPRVTYAALFSVIGETFGSGDGTSTFALPDLRGEFIRGFDDGRGVDAGRAFGSYQADEFKNHQHEFGADDQLQIAGGYTLMGIGGFNYDAQSSFSGAGKRVKTKNDTENFGGSETRPRNIALLPCIKY